MNAVRTLCCPDLPSCTMNLITVGGRVIIQYMSQDLYDDWLTRIGEKPPREVQTELPYKQCECGAAAINAAYHSYYCPMYE